MKKQSNRCTHDDTYFKELEENIIWDKKQKELLQNKMLNSIDKLDNKVKLWNVFKYASSVVAVLFVLFIGYNYLVQQEILLAGDSRPFERTTKPELQPKPEPEVMTALQYYGTYDEEESYQTIAMSDSNAMYFIPVSIQDLGATAQQSLHFSASESMQEQLLAKYDLTPALLNKPLQEVKMVGDHLELYFNKADLDQIRGSTGTSMGYYSMANFAKNFNEQVKRFTVYGDGEPFHHAGEEFDLENLEVNRAAAYFPVTTEKSIFLREEYHSFSSLEEIFSAFFSVYQRPDMDTEAIDLSMISFEHIEEDQDQTVIYLDGDLAQSDLNSQMNQESLKLLIAHGVGLNLRSNPHLLQHSTNRAKIILNGETLFDGQLSHIRYNVLKALNLEANLANQPDSTQETLIELGEIKENLQIGLTQHEVQEILGANSVEVTSAKDGLPMWRYDLYVKEGYTPSELEETGDFVDLAGLANGDLTTQIFITWTDEYKIQNFTLYYLNKEDGRVYEYRLFPDQSVKEQPVT